MLAVETSSLKSSTSTTPMPTAGNVSINSPNETPASEVPQLSSEPPHCPDVEAAAAAAAGTSSDHEFPVSNLAPWRFWALSLGVGLGLFLAMLDSSIVATSLLTIGRDLGSLDLINWVALAYTLAYLSCAVIFARIADIVGRRNAYLAAFVIFFSFSIGCGFAQTLHQLIAFRALQGIGGSGLYSLSMIIWPELSPNHLKKHIATLAGVVIGIAGVLGPILGGVLTNYVSWRWIFWINGPVGFFSMTVFALTWPDAKHLPHIQRHPWSSLDVVGSLLLIAAAALVTFAFQNAGVNPNQWSQAIFLAPLIAGVFCWIALFIWQRIVETRWKDMMPAFPLRLLRNHVYASAALTTLFLGFPFFSVIFAFPLRLQIVNGKSGLMAGVMLLPLLGGVAAGSAITGAVNGRSNRLCETLVVAGGLMVIGCALETTLSDSAALEAKALGFLPFIGLGLGLAATSATILAATEAPPGDHAASQGIVAQARVLGGSIGIAASSAVLATQELAKLGTVLTSGDASAAAGDAPEAVLVRQVFSQAFAEDMRVCAVISAAGLVIACGTYSRKRVSLMEQLSRGAKHGSREVALAPPRQSSDESASATAAGAGKSAELPGSVEKPA